MSARGTEWTPQLAFERRLAALFGLIVVVAILLGIRLFEIQVIEAEGHRAAVDRGRTVSTAVPARRGRILDREGRPLAESVESFELWIYPVRFRETNRIDALRDVAAAIGPAARAAGSQAVPIGRMPFVEARLDAYLETWRNRRALVEAVLAAPAAAAGEELGPELLAQRWSDRLWPRGELVVAPDVRVQRRLLDALLVLADDPALKSRQVLLERLVAADTVGEALGVDARALLDGIEREMEELEWLSVASSGLGAEALLRELFDREWLNLRRLDRRLEASLDDQIMVDRFGTWDAAQLAPEELEALALELRVPAEDATLLWDRLRDLRRRREKGELVDRDTVALLGEFDDVRDAGDMDAASRGKRRALARHLDLWMQRPDELKRELGRRVREARDFVESDWMSPRKKWTRVEQFKDGVFYRLDADCDFDVADRIWSSFGLGRTGFDVRTSYGRRYWRDESGFFSMLIGRVTAQGAALGGLEASLAHDAERVDDDGRAAIVGEAGMLHRRRETDGSFTELATSSAARHGRDVRLSIDREVQAAADEVLSRMCSALEAELGAGACVIDLATGDVLIASSVPMVEGPRWLDLYDQRVRRDQARRALNALRRAADVSPDEYRETIDRLAFEEERAAFWDKSTDASSWFMPPGSVMKVFSAVALLEEGVIDPDEVLHDTDKGSVALHQALVLSSNVYFRRHVRELGRDGLLRWFERFGMFRPIPELVSAAGADARAKLAWSDEGAQNLVIGQGSISLSPIEVATMMGALAGRGRGVVPRIVLEEAGAPTAVTGFGAADVSADSFARVRDAMREVAARKGGERAERIDLAGKSGTADGFGGRWAEHNQAWFAGFAPAGAPRVAYAVTCVRTRARGSAVAPFAAELVELALESLR